jgi:hypothetical protein
VQKAFEAGLINTDAIKKAFVQGAQDKLAVQTAKEGVAASKDRIEIAPLKSEAERQELLSKIKILPLQTENQVTKLGTEKRLLPGATALAVEGQQQALDATRGAQVRRLEDPTGALQLEEAAKYWDAAGLGPLPMNVEGTAPDHAKLLSAVKELQEAGFKTRIAQSGVKFTDAQEALMNAAKEKGVEGKILNADGTMKSIPEVQAILESSSKALTPLQKLDASKALPEVEKIIQQLKEAKPLIFKTDASGNIVHDAQGKPLPSSLNPVGSFIGSGLGRQITPFKSHIGYPDQYDAQDKLQQLASRLTLENTDKMKGALNLQELNLLKDAQAKLKSNEVTWETYLEQTLPMLEAAASRTRDALGETEVSGSPAPVQPAAATSNGAVQVQNVAGARALRPGTRFVLPDGTSGVAH